MGLTNLVLMSDKVDVLKAGVKAASDCKPLIYAATAETVDDLGQAGPGSQVAPLR